MCAHDPGDVPQVNTCVVVRKPHRLVSERKLLLLALRCLVVVRRKRSDVEQSYDSIIGPGLGDDASAV
jgi:hypothetical protein